MDSRLRMPTPVQRAMLGGMSLLEPTFGTRCEALAAGYLAGKGLVVRERNYRTRIGEVDLICEDGATLVFVEVKARRSARYGPGSEAVGPQKQRRLMAIAALYLVRHTDRGCRFDVVSVAIEKGRPLIAHLIDAFP
jgi:putative endonuclease